MKRILIAGLACMSGLFSMNTFAATGELWEVTFKMEMSGMSVAIPATTMHICIPKGAEKDPRLSTPRQSPKSNNCKFSDVKTSGNRTSWKVRCFHHGNVMSGSGEQTITANHYQGAIHFTSKSHGKTRSVNQTFSGKRLGTSCDPDQPARMTSAPR